MRGVLPLKASLLLTLSAPIKPGATSRLSATFERRLLEATAVLEEMERAYAKGREISEGRSSLQSFSIGAALQSAMNEVSRITGEKPMIGLLVSSLTLSSLKGLSDGASKPFRASLRAGVSSLLYRGNVEDTLKLLEALEVSGEGEVGELLERRGITKASVRVNALSPGNVYEVLGELETGFWLNLRDLDRLLELSRSIEGERSLVSAVQRAYLSLLEERGVAVRGKDVRELLKLDSALREQGGFDRLLGAVFLGTAIAAVDKWPWRA
ncbi:MAG: hypothetical protein NZ902_03585 [Acidilobaceae archaeon]|nr:hypothetical protein [Acidilobaceae archaeon]MCX8165189.1 hypothetical protein [Acidilobaceae archaeon]MDW7974295.1 hypothetical protein [Sulfolobales archaeon]